ncbi:hypothetical protein ABGB07_36220 [Micromonosporaceae bacterium B7E4]
MTTTITRPGDWDLRTGPKPPALNMVSTFYGVTVDDCGEDGDAFALGHVGKYRALAAFMRHSRENRGDDILGYRLVLDDALTRVQHLWMVNLGTDDLWLICEAEPTDPGAFPVTWWDAP